MERNCDNCKTKYEAKRAASKFCSDKCRMQYLRTHPKQKDTVSKLQVQVLYNEMLSMVQKLTENMHKPTSLPPMERKDANLPVSNAGLGSWLDNGVKSVNSRKIAIKRDVPTWVAIKRECTDLEEWNGYVEQINASDNLSDKQKNYIINQA